MKEENHFASWILSFWQFTSNMVLFTLIEKKKVKQPKIC